MGCLTGPQCGLVSAGFPRSDIFSQRGKRQYPSGNPWKVACSSVEWLARACEVAKVAYWPSTQASRNSGSPDGFRIATALMAGGSRSNTRGGARGARGRPPRHFWALPNSHLRMRAALRLIAQHAKHAWDTHRHAMPTQVTNMATFERKGALTSMESAPYEARSSSNRVRPSHIRQS